MSKGFWEKLNKPFFVLAPMLDVSDVAFRQVLVKYGKPDVFWTEFVSVDGLCSEEGREKLKKNLLQFSENERPIVAQLFGSNPECFEEAARIVSEMGFDGIDINMGCPQKNILKQGSGAELIKHPQLAKEIIRATKKGAGDLPVSVKTRIGYNKDEIDTWILAILEENPIALTIHGRTKKEMSKVPARWDLIKKCREIRDKVNKDVLIIGNGDVENLEEARSRVKETGVDGVMIGRGIFSNFQLFNPKKTFSHSRECENVEYMLDENEIRINLKVALEHAKIFEKYFGETKENKKIFGGNGRARNFALMKKFFKIYINGFRGAKELRIKLMEANDFKEVEGIIKERL